MAGDGYFRGWVVLFLGRIVQRERESVCVTEGGGGGGRLVGLSPNKIYGVIIMWTWYCCCGVHLASVLTITPEKTDETEPSLCFVFRS